MRRKFAPSEILKKKLYTKKARPKAYIPASIPASIPHLPPRKASLRTADAKFFDVATASYLMNTTGSVVHLDIVPQGSTVNTREGKAYRIKSVQLRGQIIADSAAIWNVYAMYLVWDTQPSKALAAIGDVLATGAGINNECFSNRDNTGKFRILKKWYGVLTGGTSATSTVQSNTLVPVDERIEAFDSLICECTAADTTGVIGNRISGALLLVTAGAIAAGSSDCAFNGRVRVNFADV